jgi:hypothetical protein
VRSFDDADIDVARYASGGAGRYSSFRLIAAVDKKNASGWAASIKEEGL